MKPGSETEPRPCLMPVVISSRKEKETGLTNLWSACVSLSDFTPSVGK